MKHIFAKNTNRFTFAFVSQSQLATLLYEKIRTNNLLKKSVKLKNTTNSYHNLLRI